jgi:hypothetical protein
MRGRFARGSVRVLAPGTPFECAARHESGHGAPQWNKHFILEIIDLFIPF